MYELRGPSGCFEGLDMITGQRGITSWYTRARAIAPGFISALPERPRVPAESNYDQVRILLGHSGYFYKKHNSSHCLFLFLKN